MKYTFTVRPVAEITDPSVPALRYYVGIGLLACESYRDAQIRAAASI